MLVAFLPAVAELESLGHQHMRYPFILALLTLLTSCTVLKPEGTWVQGSVWLVPQAEVRSAIKVACAGSHLTPDFVESVVVSSHSELYVYFFTGIARGEVNYTLCVVVRKENGQWRYISGGFA